MDCGKDGDWAFLVIEDRGRDVGTIYKSYGHMSFYFVADLIVVTVRSWLSVVYPLHSFCLQLCQSEKVHRAGFVHGSVKSSNFISQRSIPGSH